MNKAGFVVLGAAMAIGSVLLAGTGCSSNSGGTGGAGGGTGGATSSTTSTSTSTSTTSTSTSTTSSSATSSTSSGGAVDCTAYCTAVMANCKDPATAQYSDMTSCMNVCATFPPGMAGDMSGDSVACRTYHAGAAAGAGATMHCEHAGPTGGDKDVSDMNAGACGEGCEAFCNLAVPTCAAQYADKTACMTDCKTFKADATSYSTADTTTNDFGCRMYHLTVAATSQAMATMHCPHIVGSSPVCTK